MPRARDGAARLAEVGAELVGAVRDHRSGLRELVLDDRVHRVEQRPDLRERSLHVRGIAESLDERVQEHDDRQGARVRHDHHAAHERLGVGPGQHLVGGIGHGRDRDRRGHRRVDVLPDLLGPRGDRLLHLPGACVAPCGILLRLHRLELRHGRPLGVDRQSPAVGQAQAELHDLAVHAEVRREHRRRELPEVLAEDVLAGSALGVPAGEDGGQPANDLPVLRLRRVGAPRRAPGAAPGPDAWPRGRPGGARRRRPAGRRRRRSGGARPPGPPTSRSARRGAARSAALRALRALGRPGPRLAAAAAEHHQRAHRDADARGEHGDQDVVRHPVTPGV